MHLNVFQSCLDYLCLNQLVFKQLHWPFVMNILKIGFGGRLNSDDNCLISNI